jgi:CRP/FNR family transcriptional regulator, dissimilatory nitrate respiration regulator
MPDIRRFLSNTFLFDSFNTGEIDLLHASTTVKRVHKGEHIFSEGIDATAFFIIVSGKLKIFKISPEGKEQTIHIHAEGDLVAEAAIFDSMVYPASCIALEDSTLIRISKDGFTGLVKTHPELALKMMSGYSKRLRLFVAKIEELSLKDIKSRLAGYLIGNSSRENGVTLCRLVYSKKELASVLGTVPETLSRALAFLKQKKLIIEKNNTLIIPDAEKLGRFGE